MVLLLITTLLAASIIAFVLLVGFDYLFTYLRVKHLSIEKIENIIKRYDEAIASKKIDDSSELRIINALCDEQDLWKYYLKIKKKQLGIK